MLPCFFVCPPDRGERSETFSLGGEGDLRGIGGAPLKAPRTPAELRQVPFLGGAAPFRPKSRPNGRLASKRFAAARSQDTTFSRLTARKCCCHPRRGRAAEGIRPAALLHPRFSLLTSSHPDGRGSVAILVCGCSFMSEEYWRRVLRQDKWRAVSLESTGKIDSCPLQRNASGNWGSRGVSPLAGSRGRPRVEGLGREASLPSLAFW